MSERTELRFLGTLLTQPYHTETVRMFSEEIFGDELRRHIFRRIAARGPDAALIELAGIPQIGEAIRLALAFPPGRDMTEE